MTREADIAAKFWKSLKSDMTLMLGLVGVEDGQAQPMTAQLDASANDDAVGGPIYFFTSKDTDLVKQLGQSHAAIAHFVSKGHDVFASVHGTLSLHNDRATIDRLWNRFVAAWFPGGKDDPSVQLIRLDPGHAHIWLNENSMFAGIKLLMGSDPKKDYKDKAADVELNDTLVRSNVRR